MPEFLNGTDASHFLFQYKGRGWHPKFTWLVKNGYIIAVTIGGTKYYPVKYLITVKERLIKEQIKYRSVL